MKLLLSLLFIALPAFGQSTNASLTGTVIDPTGAAVPSVQVTAQNQQTGISMTNATNEAGVYFFPSLQPGIYRLTVEATGFRKYVLSDINVAVAAKMNINVSLEIGALAGNIEVTASPDSPLFIDTASVGGVITERKIEDLPLPDRDALGLVLTQPGLLGDNFAGTRISALNVTRDGINVMDQRINLGVNSVVFNSVDEVAEVRVITSPVDAELGRGSGHVEILTRSGTNEFHGSLWNYHRNTVLNANDWFNNLRGLPRDSLIFNNFGGRLGGPIIHNRTFFHFTYEGIRDHEADAVTAVTYTATARAGTFRFFPGVQNANADASVPTVDLQGNPVRPATATGPLQSALLFGRDPSRPGLDPTGTIQRFLNVMPLPNDFRSGDGLNTAGYTWRRKVTDGFNHYNTRIDHHLNERHGLTFSYLREDENAFNGFLPQPFPASPGGTAIKPTDEYHVRLISTLSPTKTNEFNAGAQRARYRFYAPWETPAGKAFMPTATGYGYLPVFGLVSDPIADDNGPQGRISPFYQYADRFSWIKGKHELKFGGELRFASSNGFNSFDVTPLVIFGGGFAPSPTGVNTVAIPGLGINEAAAQQLLLDLNGSVDSVAQSFNATGVKNPRFDPGVSKQRTWRQREFGLFFQDDYKLRPRLTLNLGLRWEFYGVPYDAQGRTAGLVGGSGGLYGISGNSHEAMYQPGRDKGQLTQVQLIGKNSTNPNTSLYAHDLNNWGPAVGLSWSLPYFGKDKTVLRAGYSVVYERNALRLVDIVSGDEPGLKQDEFVISDTVLNLSGVRLPLIPSLDPLQIVPLDDRQQVVRSFDNNLRTPYTQNWNFTIQRQLPMGFQLDVRYVGTKGTKLIRSMNVNEVNIFENGILDAFKTTQSGGSAPLFDRLLTGFNLGLGRIPNAASGSASLRAYSGTRGFFANNDIGGFADWVNRINAGGFNGGLLFFAGLPDNWIVVNPQFAGSNYTGNLANSTYNALILNSTKRLTQGWEVQTNYTWSRTLGEEEGDSQELLDSYRNSRNRHIDKRLLAFHRTHIFRNNVLWELPFGPNRRFLGNTHGAVGRLIGGWQLDGIFNLFSGAPMGLDSGVRSLNQFTDNTATLIGALPKDTGHVKRTDNGVVYFDGFKQVADPGIGQITGAQLLNTRSLLKAIADSSGNIIAVNPSPGSLGALSPTYLQGPPSFRLDANLKKTVKIYENKELVMRVDAINILNKPIFGLPDTDINSTTFGRITDAGGSRVVVLSLRVNF